MTPQAAFSSLIRYWPQADFIVQTEHEMIEYIQGEIGY